ncbi:Cell wall-binding protein YocH [Calidithermus terrae]|uniref:Cell wall-binding protein YocH n=1 Tax=Calidithermus terrae TaxID=1408545 RepID=A0A399EQE2_9DEIN|nr:phosphodiester glycosidase family protein [Calidithermus terrae]RIH85756.1 Cell wall-binding protein YocH [Calidithermus terrae]
MAQNARGWLWWLVALVVLFGSAQAQARKIYVVQRGDTLWGIAKRHKIGQAQLKRWNSLKSNVIFKGQKLWVATPPPSFAVRLINGPVLGVPVTAVQVNLAHPQVRVRALLPQGGLGRSGAPLLALANQPRLVAAINGGYFHPRTFSLAGDLVVAGQQLSRGRIPTALSITSDNRARIHNRLEPWRGYETVIASGPYVLRDGRVVVWPRSEGYSDPAIWGRARRSVVGLVNERFLIFVSTRQALTLSETAKVMARLGAKEALLLDGGSSTGLVWQQRLLVSPSRKLAFGIGIFLLPKPQPAVNRS